MNKYRNTIIACTLIILTIFAIISINKIVSQDRELVGLYNEGVCPTCGHRYLHGHYYEAGERMTTFSCEYCFISRALPTRLIGE